jgi:hypothetical protein
VAHQPGELDGQDVDPSRRTWRAIDKLQRGQRPNKVSTVAFRTTGRATRGNCLSLCVRGDDWDDDHKVEWLERYSPGHGIAEVTVQQALAAGFVRVVWAEHGQLGESVPGHVQAFYPSGTKATVEDAIAALRECARIVRDPEGWVLREG